jgi:hypothetical protein
MIKILVVTANPFEDWNFDSDQEIRAIQDATDKAPEDFKAELRVEHCVTYPEFPTILSRQTPDVLHMSLITFRERGMYFDDVRGKSRRLGPDKKQIARAEAYNNTVQPSVTFSGFARDLGKLRNGNLRCLVLTSDLSEADALDVATAIEGVAIGWPIGLENEETLAFVQGFYKGLVLGKGMQVAFDMGESQLRARFPCQASINLPELTKYRDDLDLDTFLAQHSPSTATNDEGVKAKEFLLQHFSDDDLNELCFDMSLDYESIAGSEKRSKVVNLIKYCRDRGMSRRLMANARKLRPQTPW